MDKNSIIAKLGRSDNDVGSTGVQIGLMTLRISHLTGHLKKNAKDRASQRGLKSIVEARKKLLKYLKRVDLKKFHDVVDFLKIRH